MEQVFNEQCCSGKKFNNIPCVNRCNFTECLEFYYNFSEMTEAEKDYYLYGQLMNAMCENRYGKKKF